MERRVPTKDEVLAYLKEDRNWGRWGDDDQVGAVNMVTPEKRLAAARGMTTNLPAPPRTRKTSAGSGGSPQAAGWRRWAARTAARRSLRAWRGRPFWLLKGGLALVA